jgi:hypothetical protein
VFGELPSIFGKGFFVGHFVPTCVIIVVIGAIAAILSDMPVYTTVENALRTSDQELLGLRIGLAIGVVWVLAMALLAINFQLIRMLEGYGTANPARLFKWYSVWIFTRMTRELAGLTRLQQIQPLTADQDSRRRRLRVLLGNEFPENAGLVLPTRFGNVVRAFERYPQIVYNIEPIRTWLRLQAVIPEDYRNMLDDAKALLDFYVNLWFGAVLVAVFACGRMAYAWYEGTLSSTVISQLAILLVAAGVLAGLLAKQARGPAAQWGELVKGAFDLYRGDLCRQLGFKMPRSIERERQMWGPICRTMLYRTGDYAGEFTVHRPLPGESGGATPDAKGGKD